MVMLKLYNRNLNFRTAANIFWHGSPSGNLQGSAYGLHVGTYEAARQALNARIGIPVKGNWDGTREYGKTLLAGKKTLKEIGEYPTGYNTQAPDMDYYPDGTAKYSDGSFIPLTVKPDIVPYKIVGKMNNTMYNPYDDFKANGYMRSQIKQNRAQNGYYYKNEGEDANSISAVIPSRAHLERINKNLV